VIQETSSPFSRDLNSYTYASDTVIGFRSHFNAMSPDKVTSTEENIPQNIHNRDVISDKIDLLVLIS
jgi:hypothetical protein